MKTLIFSLTLILSLSSGFSSQAQNHPDQHQQQYFEWCDFVQTELAATQAIAQSQYQMNQYAAALTTVESSLRRLQSGIAIYNSNRPFAYTEIGRTLNLLNSLKTSPALQGSNTQKQKVLAFVALNRIDVIKYYAQNLDVPYSVPSMNWGGCAYCVQQHQMAFEAALSSAAQYQLTRTQDFATRQSINGSYQVYPLLNSGIYFTIVSQAAHWAANDLQGSLYPTIFACVIQQLRNVGNEASAVSRTMGERNAVQYIYQRVESLQSTLSASPYGCQNAQQPNYGSCNHGNHDHPCNQ